MRAEGYQEKKDVIAGWPVKICSYQVGSSYHVSIHNQEPGAWICKQEGATLEEAERKARARAEELLSRTRRVARDPTPMRHPERSEGSRLERRDSSA